MSKITKIDNNVQLYDAYSSMLTDVQKQIFEMYFFEDMSLAEISEQRGTSRSAVQDALKKVEKVLADLEDKLNLVQKSNTQKELLNQLEDKLVDDKQKQILSKIREL